MSLEDRFYCIDVSPEDRFYCIEVSPGDRFHCIEVSPKDRFYCVEVSPGDRFYCIYRRHLETCFTACIKVSPELYWGVHWRQVLLFRGVPPVRLPWWISDITVRFLASGSVIGFWFMHWICLFNTCPAVLFDCLCKRSHVLRLIRWTLVLDTEWIRPGGGGVYGFDVSLVYCDGRGQKGPGIARTDSA